ncbi:hypothetical protein BTM25_00010 [Actinomadura rubteroloni]|uniref:Prenyltransferase n=1 Tax=Actinomadura rubteroloni TaxID=1926885 RepID=A0A2P4UKN8_9ACTN|nr:hypothetical protein [Actinomadura rubteroloni]POM25620.1 hypothetical protein BTM25_00010 [Actinomadura rubteroloni]
MSLDLTAVARFMTAHARLLDRLRFDALTGDAEPRAVLDALNGYRNPDGGYGRGLEPDLRAVESQPAAAFHAFEVLAELPGDIAAPDARTLADWLTTVTCEDGGLPFALPVADPAACAPFWVDVDPDVSSLQITAIVATHAHRVPALAGHPWLDRATRYCLREIDALGEAPHALVLSFAVRLLDQMGETDRIRKLGAFLPADGLVPVAGGLPDETLHPLDFAPLPGRPARELFAQTVIDADLDRLAAGRQDDGGWVTDFASYSPAAALDWRGYTTVAAVGLLRANGRA